MENYIVRVYRRDKTDPQKLAGVFESVENETRNNFTSLDSLIALLTPSLLLNPSSSDGTEKSTAEQSPATATLSK